MARIIGIGETIYNVTMRHGHPDNGMPGGDVFNTMLSLGRRGAQASLISEVGDDRLGRLILDFMQDNGVITDYMYAYHEGRTPLSLAHLADDGSADYDYYVNYPSVGRLDVVWPRIDNDDILFFGSRYVLQQEVHNTVIDLVNYASERKALVVYFPDLHKMMPGQGVWLMPNIIDCLEKCHVLIMSEQDMEQLYHQTDPDRVYLDHVKFYGPAFIVIRSDGSFALRTQSLKKDYPSPVYAECRNMIGVDDAFCAGVLHRLDAAHVTQATVRSLDEAMWDEIFMSGSRFAAEVSGSEEAFVGI